MGGLVPLLSGLMLPATGVNVPQIFLQILQRYSEAAALPFVREAFYEATRVTVEACFCFRLLLIFSSEVFCPS